MDYKKPRSWVTAINGCPMSLFSVFLSSPFSICPAPRTEVVREGEQRYPSSGYALTIQYSINFHQLKYHHFCIRSTTTLANKKISHDHGGHNTKQDPWCHLRKKNQDQLPFPPFFNILMYTYQKNIQYLKSQDFSDFQKKNQAVKVG